MRSAEEDKVDILENHIYKISDEILSILLMDHSTNKNILWCTDNYKKNGAKYGATKHIEVDLITGENGNVIKPRTKKKAAEKKIRIKEKAEVFTPSWACNHQNNLVDEVWFGEKDIFNKENNDKTWTTKKRKIPFIEKTWQDYVLSKRIEIACGEAPYVISRYDTVTGEIIKTQNRIGILDRKIRVVNENTSEDEWFEWIKKAYQSTYAYDWQGDSLLIARENLLYSFIDYYKAKFKKMPKLDELKEIASIISWNVWQMDGLKNVVPMSCKKEVIGYDLFGEKKIKECKGCVESNINEHNGIYCVIKDWETDEIIKYNDVLAGGNNYGYE